MLCASPRPRQPASDPPSAAPAPRSPTRTTVGDDGRATPRPGAGARRRHSQGGATNPEGRGHGWLPTRSPRERARRHNPAGAAQRREPWTGAGDAHHAVRRCAWRPTRGPRDRPPRHNPAARGGQVPQTASRGTPRPRPRARRGRGSLGGFRAAATAPLTPSVPGAAPGPERPLLLARNSAPPQVMAGIEWVGGVGLAWRRGAGLASGHADRFAGRGRT